MFVTKRIFDEKIDVIIKSVRRKVIVIDIDSKKIEHCVGGDLRRALCMHGCVIIDHYQAAASSAEADR